ncbi:MAG TPA: ATP-binding cassette domain-containing protein [Candidatus Dormibacteraeota bacterium]|jgi:branched-chain amino acid transport system ATP-binding protein|nr:ATP-binding cassette domain-containing protein [Candidatus Dormibacteraeota bacterium]
MPPPSPPALHVEGVAVRFGGNVVLHEVSLVAEPGRVTALIGPNGAGKTTLLNAITGFVRSQQGSVRFGDTVLTGRSVPAVAATGIGRSFQSGHVFTDLTVRENLLGPHGLGSFATAWREFVGTQRGRAERRAAEEAAERMAERLGLAHLLDTRAGDLAAGAQKLVDLGRAMVGGPAMLLCDEPAAGLSASERATIARLLRDQVADGSRGVLLIDHDMRFVMETCDTVHVLNFGELIASGPPEVVQKDALVIAAYLGA